MKKLSPKAVLGLPMQENDAEAKTIREYLKALLKEIWIEEECFSGKRPFGNSGWKYDLAGTLVTAEVIEGFFDEEGYLEDCDDDALETIILDAIKAL